MSLVSTILTKLYELFCLFVLTPFFACTCRLDDMPIAQSFTSRIRGFPRNRPEVVANKKKFFADVGANDIVEHQKASRRFDALRRNAQQHSDSRKLDQASSAVSQKLVHPTANAVMVRMDALDGISTEPLKNSQLGLFEVEFYAPATQGGGGHRTTIVQQWFCKFTSERKITYLLKGVMSAFASVPSEVAFYRNIAPLLEGKIQVPQCVAAFSSRLFGKSCLVLEIIPKPWATVPDWKGATAGQLQALTEAQATLHATFWNPPRNMHHYKETVGFANPDKQGLAWMDLLRLYFHKKGFQPWHKRLFELTDHYFRATSTSRCLSHGDCRPGNMLFKRKEGGGQAVGDDNDDAWEVVMADWEAMNCTPYLWDHTYMQTIGQTTENRRRLGEQQLRHYAQQLLTQSAVARRDLVLEATKKSPAASSSLQEDIDAIMDKLLLDRTMIVIAIYYFGVMLICVEGVGEVQGNTEEDCNAWGERIGHALKEYIQPDQLAEILLHGTNNGKKFSTDKETTVKDLHGLIAEGQKMIDADAEKNKKKY